jgi:hypothetical protein
MRPSFFKKWNFTKISIKSSINKFYQIEEELLKRQMVRDEEGNLILPKNSKKNNLIKDYWHILSQDETEILFKNLSELYSLIFDIGMSRLRPKEEKRKANSLSSSMVSQTSPSDSSDALCDPLKAGQQPTSNSVGKPKHVKSQSGGDFTSLQLSRIKNNQSHQLSQLNNQLNQQLNQQLNPVQVSYISQTNAC